MAGPSAASINTTRKRFIQLNAQRLDRTLQMLEPKQRAFLDALPMLLHFNHRLLPGYVGDDAPAGVSGYLPTADAQAAVKQFSSNFSYTRKPIRQHDIYSLFLMGSAGSIAFATHSDLDIWLCHREDLTTEELSSLFEKVNALEKWAGSLNLEVHFFLMNAERFRAGQLQELSEESSGSAQHLLLLDEFYRTSLWIAGRIPVWWFVPPDMDSEYDIVIKKIRTQQLLKENEYIDFGGIARIPVQEFFGAAVWQVYKGLDSPYKSVLKIILTESYAHAYPGTIMLSGELKRRLYAGELLLEKTDPYLCLIARIEEYLKARLEDDRLENARRYFYIKLDIALSERKQVNQWRTPIITELVKRWQWDDEKLELLDERRTWKIDRIKEEKNILVKELSQSYAYLSQFARQQSAESTLRKEDLTILGRKIYAAFERKAGKIEMVNLGIAPSANEDNVTLIQDPKSKEETWFLFRGRVDVSDASKHRPLRSAHGVVEIIAWCYFNRVIDENTYIAVHSPTRERISTEINTIIKALNELFPKADLPDASVQNYASTSRIAQSAIFINVGRTPKAVQTGMERQIVDHANDIFHFGAAKENLVQAIDQIIVTSWKEVYVFRYHGMNGFMEAICQYIQWSPLSNYAGPPPIKLYSFTAHIGHVIAARVKTVWDEVVDIYFGLRGHPDARFVLQAEKGYYILYRDMNILRHEFCEGYAKLLALLERPLFNFSPLYAERYSLRRTFLPILFRANKSGIIQTFYQTKQDRTVLYVFDEHGALFVHETDEIFVDSLVHHFVIFLKSVTRRQAALTNQVGLATLPEKLEFYEIITQNNNPYIERREIEYERVDPRYFNISVIGELMDEKASFRIFCDNKEFSSLEHGDKLFEATAKHIAALRVGGTNYPCYITDIDLAPGMLGLEQHRKIPTILYLHYKRRVEQRLDRVFKEMGLTQ
ncbi:MAG: class I adenylate cyclase [Gammaproteobacteria bacterium]|nr:class I adenylate cyclase [Gammaproteobacteria bacterium]